MDQQQQGSFSLKRLCKQRLKGAFISLRQSNANVQTFILVVDEHTVKVISAYMKMAELMELGISAIEKLELARKPFPKLNVIYMISACQSSVQRVLDDFANKKAPQYGNVHFLFTNDIDQALMQKIASSEALITRVASFKVLNLDFSCAGDYIFNLDSPDCLSTAFSDKNFAVQGILKNAAQKLATLLISFEKFYSFELLYNVHENKISEQVARFTQQRLFELLKSFKDSKNEQYDNIEKEAGKITVLMVDRSFDPTTPLLHDFFYQSMVYDLLDINNDVFEQEPEGSQPGKKVILSDNDELFTRYKFRHIGEVLEGIPAEFKQFIANNANAKVQQGQMTNLDLKQMSEIVRQMPQYNELLGKYTLHMKMIEKSWAIFEKKELKELGDLEQSLATGIDKEGKSISTTKILTQVGSKLLSDNLDQMDKLRLMLLTTIALEMNEKDRKTLTDKIGFEHSKAILNLIYLGVNPQKGGQKKSKSSNRIGDNLKKQAKNKMANATMDLCRNTPILESTVEAFVESNYKKPMKFESIKINEDGMDNNKPASKSLREKGGQIAKMMHNKGDEESNNNRPKLIIFVVGGIGYNEIRSILSNPKICQSQITIVGSTQIMKPKDFCQSLLQFKTE